MNLTFLCKSCSKYSILESSARIRTELRDEKGETFYATCSHCAGSQSLHVNQVFAETPIVKKMINIGISVTLSALFTGFLWKLGWVSTLTISLPFLIYYLLSKNETDNNNLFNKHRV